MDRAERAAELLEQIRALAATGKLEAAEEICRQLLDVSPEDPAGWSWLGLLATAGRRWGEAESALRKAVSLRPCDPHSLSYLSVALRERDEPREAEDYARQAIAIDARQPSYWINLGAALRDQRRSTEAVEAYRHSLALDASQAATWQALATALQESGELDAAQAAFERSLTLAPGGEATVDCAYLHCLRGHPHEAIALLANFLLRSPHVPYAWIVLTHALKLAGENARAEAACREALKLAPRSHQARHQLAELLTKRWALSEAEAEARQLVTDDPAYAPGWAVLGLILGASGQQPEAEQALRRAAELDPIQHYSSRLLCSLQYADEVDPKQLLRAHEEWAAARVPVATVTAPTGAGSSQKLKLGFISPDFGQHPIAFLALAALEQLNRSDCSVICYSDGTTDDAYTARFRAISSGWRNICGECDQHVASLIAHDEVDVLIDLAGHQGNRLGVFQRRPAPVQITWLGYVGTTGLAEMDYLLADRQHVRVGEESLYRETVLRMSDGYCCYQPLADAPPVMPLPALRNQYFTFGSFNHTAKLSPSILAAWAEIMVRVPHSRLFLRYGGLNDLGFQQRVWRHFADRKISAERIRFAGWGPCREIMQEYCQIDLALDTQPYSGGLTTCEALWMGVPVVTWPGKTFAGRHATSHLTTAGVPQFIADSREAYIDLAVHWASRIDELTATRSKLREQMRSSPLCNAQLFAHNLLRLLQSVRGKITSEFS